MTSAELQRQLTPQPESVATARHLLEGFEEMVAPEKLVHLRLLVSELVTNAVMHTGLKADQSIELSVLVRDRLVRVEVRDGGPGFDKPQPELPEPTKVDGRGLCLVETLSERWDVTRDEDHTIVWFELTR